ncbi:ABC transporter [Amycolatopsis methanolica 239]|uniref:ABC transporter n=1 Tax=Amycolatopsis methanolica 239 TaxID=1068978 RepID=A0A076MP54_AMYME|nr:ABC transporter [Amycolatopsis methanolica 239]
MPVIEVRKLRKHYGGKPAVEDVSFTVGQGEISGILGPNGAGKTTTVECLEGLRCPDGGAATVLGLDPWRDTAELRQRLGVQLQESRLPDKLRVGEALELYASFYRNPADPDVLLDQLGLSGRRGTAYRKVLDELTTGLDPRARRDTWEVIEGIRDRGVTILLVTHFMAEAERLCDRIAVIDAGRVVAVGTPAGLVARVADEQVIRFRPSEPVPDELFTGLPEVRTVTRRGGQVEVSGVGNVLHAVTSVLARRGILVGGLRVEQAGVDDAFVALTGRRIGQGDHWCSPGSPPSRRNCSRATRGRRSRSSACRSRCCWCSGCCRTRTSRARSSAASRRCPGSSRRSRWRS